MTEQNQRIEGVLDAQGMYVSTTVGVSMYPMLRDRRDTVVISPCKGRLQKYDVPLYRRGNDYVLHRVIDVRPEGYIIRGDNCMKKENVKEEQIVGVLTSFFRGNKEINMNGFLYRAYARCWCFLFPLRIGCNLLRGLARRIRRR